MRDYSLTLCVLVVSVILAFGLILANKEHASHAVSIIGLVTAAVSRLYSVKSSKRVQGSKRALSVNSVKGRK